MSDSIPAFDALDVVLFICGLGALAAAVALICVSWDKRPKRRKHD
jgi:hypothetical protein